MVWASQAIYLKPDEMCLKLMTCVFSVGVRLPLRQNGGSCVCMSLLQAPLGLSLMGDRYGKRWPRDQVRHQSCSGRSLKSSGSQQCINDHLISNGASMYLENCVEASGNLNLKKKKKTNISFKNNLKHRTFLPSPSYL